MKYDITYECRSSEGVFRGYFEFESDQTPNATDREVIDSALKDSTKFMQKGLGGLEILDISHGRGGK
ncbi:MAG: hypothetical protein WC023_07680 [Rhodocyclaceae bacterium]